MKRKVQILIGTFTVSILAFSGLSQDTRKTAAPDSTRGHMPHAVRADRLNGAAKASDIIGMTVKNYQGKKLGKVEDLAVDVESGRLVLVFVSTGGFIGIGDMMTAVPPGALHHDVAQKVLHLDADKEKLKGTPKFETGKSAACCNSNHQSEPQHLSDIYRHYGEESAFNFIHAGDVVLDGRNNTSQFLIPSSRLNQVQKASKLMGTAVKNLHDEKLGKVENILLDLPSGRIVAIIVSSGGFLGMGDELSAIPPVALHFNTNRDTLQLDVSKETLSRAPHFKANQWPDFSQPSYASGVYRAYQVEPYFTAAVTTEPDNTARNVRDRDGRTLTPLDQGNSKADVATTTQIRKKIIAEKHMSVNARNVKIITNNGQVTLRGPVNTAEEKRLIGEIANRIAREENVDNQLEVKLTASSNN